VLLWARALAGTGRLTRDWRRRRLDIDLDTLLSISCGCLFELIILIATRVHAEVKRRRSAEASRLEYEKRERLGIRTDDSIMRDNVSNLTSQVDSLQKQVLLPPPPARVPCLSRPGQWQIAGRASMTSRRARAGQGQAGPA
jgi:hypothetical protein